ncbi:MAG: hypothetical protein ACRCZP_19215, partial [Phycicoccus sp.]
ELWLYCHKAEEARGTLIGIRRDDATPPATFPITWSDPLDQPTIAGADDLWPVPGWAWVDGSGLVNAIRAGGNALGVVPVLGFGTAATGFRGFGFSAPLRPLLRVTYIK